MAYCFKRKESVSKAVRRLACAGIEHAIECLKDSDRAETIHCARKEIKKTRAVLRLARARIPKKEYRRLLGELRKAARRLSASRDAYVKVQTLRSLAGHFKGQLGHGAMRRIRTGLRNACADEIERFGKEKTANAVETILRRARKTVECLEVSGGKWKALSPGVKNTYRQGRRAYQTAVNDSSPENFHEWRKRAKDLWYHVRLLRPIWPEQLDAMASELEMLGERLGDDHDLSVLRQDVDERFGDRGNARELETLSGLIEQRQRDLRAEALELGARFYAEKPSAFCDRLAKYWQTWRRGRNAVVSSAAAVS